MTASHGMDLTPTGFAAQAREILTTSGRRFAEHPYTTPGQPNALEQEIAAALGAVCDAARAEAELEHQQEMHDVCNVVAAEERERCAEEVRQLREAVEVAWGVIANASDWAREGEQWRKAAIRWRDSYLPLLTATEPPHG